MSKLHTFLRANIIIAATVLMPITAQAASFDYDQLTLFSTRPIDSNYVLSFFGDVSNNEGYTLINNASSTAPDSGHVSTAKNALPGNSAYYTTGRDASPDSATAGGRSATLESVMGFPNFFKYLEDNNISLSTIGYSYGQKAGLDYRKTLNLGKDELGKDWWATPDSPIEQRIYRANPGDTKSFITFGTTPIITYNNSPIYFAVDNGDTPDFTDNFNVFLGDPKKPNKVTGLSPLESGLADAFLKDVAAAGGLIQEVSEDILKPDQVQTSLVQIDGETYDITYIGFPITIRAVQGSVSVPEPSTTLGFMLLVGGGVVTQIKRHKRSVQ
ncbi:PEP-CTERM sorting domain-containing protein [Anabaena sp. CCY 9910]|uniref:PEP-CTERM sorting domain-containing protein n=1 Tax=Anabaena sp. CCY 9910 TaxID=3103870 RepID=UPI0039E12A6C